MSMRNRLEKKSTDKIVEEVEVESVDSGDSTEEDEGKSSPGGGAGPSKSSSGQWDARPRMQGDSCCNDGEEGHKKSKAKAGKKKADGYNWSAMAVLILFLAIPLLTGLSFLNDWLNPKAAAERAVASNLFRCYNAVGDQDKLSKINHIVTKYKGKERSLYAQLRSKYGEEYPECDNFRA